eukprot:342098_1
MTVLVALLYSIFYCGTASTLNLSAQIPNKYAKYYSKLELDDFDEYESFITADYNQTIEQLNNLQLLINNVSNENEYPLRYLPIGVKDNINTLFYPTTSGTNALKNFVPPTNAEIVNQLIDAGAIIVGKTNMHELALGITTCNQAYGCCINPLDKQRICGGSSGGSAAAIAAGYIPFALGTDTGGSVRIPAACNNIIGFIPTQDLYSTEGVFPLSYATDTVGLMSNDIELIKSVHFFLSNDIDIKRLKPDKKIKIGIPINNFQNDMHPNIDSSFQNTLNSVSNNKLFDLIFDNEIDFDILNIFKVSQDKRSGIVTTLSFEFPRAASHYLDLYKSSIRLPELLEQSNGFSKSFMQSLLDINSVAYSNMSEYRQAIRNNYELINMFKMYMIDNNLDVFAYPTITVEPPLRIKEEFKMESNGKTFDTVGKILSNTIKTAISGFPCITIPGCKANDTKGKFVAGFEMCALPNNDAKLLHIASIVVNIVNDGCGYHSKTEL